MPLPFLSRLAVCAMLLSAATVPAQSLSVLWTFTNLTTGAESLPNAGLIVSSNTLYGVETGGADGTGAALFALPLNGGGLTNIYEFASGSFPDTTLAMAGQTFYGVQQFGGATGDGAIFQVNADGSGFVLLDSFSGVTNGLEPSGGVLLAGGALYGTTFYGANRDGGTLFAAAANGSGFTNLYTFASIAPNAQGIETNNDGFDPEAALVMDGGVLYGTTFQGGVDGGGTVFSINPDGSNFTVLHSFAYLDGFSPAAALTITNGVLYGTTEEGGTSGNGVVFQMDTNGQNFAVLHDFTATPSPGYTNADGAAPHGALLLVNNLLYGSAEDGGLSAAGTIFCVDTNSGQFATLYSFTHQADGAFPEGALAFVNNTLYGVTSGSGAGSGTIYALALAPAPCPLNIQAAAGSIVLTWTNAAFSLQSSAAAGGPYAAVPGAFSPWTVSATNAQAFFRLQSP